MDRARRWPLALGILLFTVGCDQATKQIAVATLAGTPRQSLLGGLLRLEYAENPGAFLGMGGRVPENVAFWIFVVGVGLLLLGLGAWLFLAKDRQSPAVVVALALMLAGGASNWVDRVTNDGRVVDFLNLGIGGVRTGIFNVADVAIMAGAVVAFIASAKANRAPPAPPERAQQR